MVAIAKSGIHFTDPREFLRSLSAASVLAITPSSGTPTAMNVAGGFTELAKRGVSDNSSFTAATYKTILTISSGIGLVSNIIGPTGLAGTPTTTFEVTVDGVLTEVAVVATTTGQRAILGPIWPHATMFTAQYLAELGADSINAGKDTGVYSTNARMMGWPAIRGFGIPCLVFRTSLLIRIKSSENNSTTTNVQDSSGVAYMSMS